MTDNSNPFCMEFYTKCRLLSNNADAIPSDIGINWSKPFSGLCNLFVEYTEKIFSKDKILFYNRPGGDLSDRMLISELLNLYIGKDTFSFEDIVITNSSSEALEIFFDFLSKDNYGSILPLPCYFKYDLLSIRKGIPVSKYYNLDGELYDAGNILNKNCLIVNNPDAISGKYRESNFYEKIIANVDYKVNHILYDLCYLMLDNLEKGESHNFFEKECKKRLESKTFVLSPSKDISLAGFRSGILISQNKQLIDFAKNKILERYFSVNLISSYSTILYILLLIGDKYFNNYHPNQKKDVKLNEVIKILNRYNYDSHFLESNFYENFFLYHNQEVLKRIYQNFEFMSSIGNIFDFSISKKIPDCGFSTLWKLKRDLIDTNQIIELTQKVSIEHKVNLFSGYYNGGNLNVWNSLYPNQFLLRINASLSRDIVLNQFNVLHKIF